MGPEIDPLLTVNLVDEWYVEKIRVWNLAVGGTRERSAFNSELTLEFPSW